MPSRKEMISDSLFWVQIIAAIVLCGSQFFCFLETTKGQLLAMFLVMEGYFFLNLLLSVSAHTERPSRATGQLMGTYILWLALIGSNIAAIFINGSYEWNQNDTSIAVLAIVGTVALVVVAKLKGLGLQDPMLKSLLGILFKTVPQLIMAYEITQRGGAGIPAAAIVAGHVTSLIRIGQVLFALFESGRDRNRIWLCVSETGNEVSWMVVTIVWLVV